MLFFKKISVALTVWMLVLLFYTGHGIWLGTASEEKGSAIPSEAESSVESLSSETLFHLGMQYLKGGKGIRKNKPLAEHYLLLASEAQHVEAQVQVALLYLKAPKAKRNEAEARRWLNKAAQQGNATAQYTLALLWIQGRGGNQDTSQALPLLKKALQQGYIPAYTTLGILYTTGGGVTPNLPLAFQYLEFAAKHQEPVALFRLGLMYQTGLGVKQDSFKALEYLRLSVKGRYRSAQKYVDAIESQLAVKTT
jgi:TPR repeat protein